MLVFSDQPILQKCFLQLFWRPNWEFLIFDFDNDIVKRENCCCCCFFFFFPIAFCPLCLAFLNGSVFGYVKVFIFKCKFVGFFFI